MKKNIIKKRRGTIVITSIYLLLIILLSLCIPFLSDLSPTGVQLVDRLKSPGSTLSTDRVAILGTDSMGRDILIRSIYGARVSLIIGASAVLFAGALGILLGLISGYIGGKVDLLVMRLVDIQLAFPSILMALVVISVLGPSIENLIISLGLTRWVSYARLARGSVLSVKEKEYVEGAKAIGANNLRIMIKHILPNIFTPILILATIEFGRVIIAEAALSFLGLGVQPPTPSWGVMISEGREYLFSGWWITFFPGFFVCLSATALGFLGDAIRDVLDPHMKI